MGMPLIGTATSSEIMFSFSSDAAVKLGCFMGDSMLKFSRASAACRYALAGLALDVFPGQRILTFFEGVISGADIVMYV